MWGRRCVRWSIGVRAESGGEGLDCLGTSDSVASAVKGSRVGSDGASIVFVLPVVEVALPHGLPLPGARTAQMKVLSESLEARSLKLELEAEGGAVVMLKVRRNGDKVNLQCGWRDDFECGGWP